jgi:hypothetical protein
VHVRRVSSEQDPPSAVAIDHTVVDPGPTMETTLADDVTIVKFSPQRSAASAG